MTESEGVQSRSMRKKERKSISYLIRMNLNKLTSEVKLVLEKAENIGAEETQEESRDESKSKSISLERKRMLMNGHLKIIEGLISRANELEKEWKEALHSVENKDEDYEFDLYESYLNTEECLFSRCHKMYYVRNFLTEEIGRTHRLCEEESRNEGSNAKPGARENEGRSLTELIEKLVTTSKPPTLSPIEFDGNPRMWGQFTSQFEEAIHKRMDLTPTQKFMHLLSSLKGEAKEEISDLMVNEENYPIAMKNLYERYGDRNQRIYELYKSLENVHCSKKDPFRKIRELLNILSQLKGLGENIETMQLNVMVIERIPQDMAKSLKKKKYRNPEWKMEDTINYLKEKMKIEEDFGEKPPMKDFTERTKMQSTKSSRREYSNWENGIRRTTVCSTAKEKTISPKKLRQKRDKFRLPCIFCGRNHWNDECDIYPTATERLERLKKLGLCELCMKKDHSQQSCKRKLKCFHCGSEHNSALCKKQDKLEQGKDYQNGEQMKERPKTVAATMVDDGVQKTYMMCKEVKIVNPKEPGNTIKALIFFDTGSDCNYITESIVNKLKLRQTSPNVEMLITGMVGTRKCESRKVTFGVQTLSGNVKNIQAYIVDSIIERIPYLINSGSEKLEKGKWGKPDILLGMEGIADLIIRNPMKQSSGEIIMETEVGMVTGGIRKMRQDNVEVGNNESHKIKAIANITKKESQLQLDQIEQTWKLEAIGIKDLMTECQDDKALEAFQKSLTVNSEGRCVVGWPWKNQEITPAKGYGLAQGRLRSTIRRLKKSPELLGHYDEYFKNLLEEGVIEKVGNQNETSRVSYLPHQAVLTPQKSTTKLRVVFDASAKTNEGPSLNECLYKGPVMLPSLIGILLRARQGRYLVIADVEKAFLQVSLRQEDRDVTRFLWLKDKSKEANQENLVTFRFARVPFGIISSPFLLTAVIRHLLSEESFELSIEIAKNLYVDDVVLTSENESESTRKAKAAKELFKKVKMQLREFHANHDIDMNDERETTEKTKVKLLGIEWNTSNDKFTWNWKVAQGDLQTKRQILQFYAAIYDPLGLLGPIILPWKLLIQDLWKKDMSWDEKLEPEEMRRCLELERAFNQSDVLEAPRWTPKEYSEIHVFVDASEKAVGLAVYARRSSNTPCKPQLIYGKTRLIPKRENRNQSASIPRLELLAVTLGVRALEFIRREIEVEKAFLWTDSACVLYWLRKPPVGSRYISNRIDEIRRCKEIEFRHVRSTNNPADKASRGLLPENLRDDLLWWNGPSWLWEPKENWPENKVTEENIISVCMNIGLMQEEEIQSQKVQSQKVMALIDETRFSSLLKLTRTMLYVLRFLAKVSNGRIRNLIEFSKENFTFKEYEKATQLLVKMAQSNITQKEIEYWGLRKDQNGNWRCVGRLRRAMPQIEDFPYFISKGKFAELIVKYYHEKSFHASVHYTWTRMRQRYWIPHGRAYIKKILRKICKGCAMWVVTPFEQPDFPPYPTARVTATQPFETVGVDLFGPIIIMENHAKTKGWIALFTCLATRAVHLEVMEKMTTQQYVQAFRRFMSRRKQPKLVISDNAKNLIAASKVLIELNRIGGETLEWEFITPGAPWQGGIYERMVGVVKRSLRRAIGRKFLNNAELITLVAELEVIINERPLVDIEEIGLVLRPEDFLHPGSARGEQLMEERDYNKEKATASIEDLQTKELTHQYVTICKRLDHLWKVWREEYLEELRKRAQRKHRGPRSRIRREPEIDELVLLKGDCPRNTWKMGRVHRLIRGKDGICRSAVVRTANGNELLRAVGHLYPLEISGKEQGQEDRSPRECR